MRYIEGLRSRFALALLLGSPACRDEVPAGESTHVAFGRIKTGAETPKDPTPDGDEGKRGEDQGDESQDPRDSDGEADDGGETTPPTGYCTYVRSKKEASDSAFGTAEHAGCVTAMAPPPEAAGPAALDLDVATTDRMHADGHDGFCCYVLVYPERGRPLLTAQGPWRPGVRPARASERGPRHGMAEGLAPARARAIAAAWLRDARLEWASVAAFERAAAELTALAAPPELVAAHRVAAQDECRHAATCLRFARDYGGRAWQLQPLPPLRPRPLSRLDLAFAAFEEGATAETVAAIVALRSAERARPEIARALRTIARDEADHATLAWATIGWALRDASPAARRAWVRDALRRAPAPPRGPAPTDRDAAHGRLHPSTERAIAAGTWRDVVRPLLEAFATGDDQLVSYSSFSGSNPRLHGSYPAGGVS